MVITGLTRNQLGSDPPRVRISPSPPKKTQLHFCVAESFQFVVRFEQDGFSERKNCNLPVDDCKVRVRAEATVASGESRPLCQKMSLQAVSRRLQALFYLPAINTDFFINRFYVYFL